RPVVARPPVVAGWHGPPRPDQFPASRRATVVIRGRVPACVTAPFLEVCCAPTPWVSHRPAAPPGPRLVLSLSGPSLPLSDPRPTRTRSVPQADLVCRAP